MMIISKKKVDTDLPVDPETGVDEDLLKEFGDNIVLSRPM